MLAHETEDKMIRILLFFVILAGVGVMLAPLAIGTPEFAKKEIKSCVYCHIAIGKPDLNDAGKYYKDHNLSLEGYEPKKP